MPKAYSYIRFSTAEQAKGDSLRRQMAAAETWAFANGVELDERLTDAGLSAYHGRHRERGALGTFLAAVEAGEIERGSILIVESLDRLSREDVLSALEQLTALIRAGVEVVTLADGQRYSRQTIENDWTRLMVSIVVMARANEESERKSQRIRAAWTQKKAAAQDRALSRMCVGWCRIENGRYVLISEHAETVRRIFEMCVGGIGLDSIARQLNQEGVPQFGRSVVGWYPSYVKKIIFNRSVIGFYQPRAVSKSGRILDGSEIAGVYPAAISEPLFYAAQAAVALRRNHKLGRSSNGYGNLLSGLVRCACGKPMVFLNKTKTRGDKRYPNRYLVCDGRRRGTGCDADSGWWSYERAENIVLDRVRHVDFAALNRAEADAAAEARGNVAGLEAALEKARRRHKALLAAFDADTDDATVAEIRTAGAEVKRLAAEVEVASAAAAQMTAGQDGGDRAAALEELRDKIESPDDAVRIEARARVQHELRRVIERLSFSRDDIVVSYRLPAGTGGFRALSFLPAALVQQQRPQAEAYGDEMPDQPTLSKRGGLVSS